MRPDIVMGILLILLIGLAVYVTVDDSAKWDAFKLQHKCKVVSREDSSTSLGVSGSGNVVVVGNPGKTGYLCDDGITYYK